MKQNGYARKRSVVPPGVVAGLIIMGLGGAFMLHNLRILHVEDTLRYWPVGLILMGVVSLLNKGLLKVGGHVLIVLGSVLLAGFLGYEDQVERFWPLGLVYLGTLMILRALFTPRPPVAPPPSPLPPAPPAPQDDDARLP